MTSTAGWQPAPPNRQIETLPKNAWLTALPGPASGHIAAVAFVGSAGLSFIAAARTLPAASTQLPVLPAEPSGIPLPALAAPGGVACVQAGSSKGSRSSA